MLTLIETVRHEVIRLKAISRKLSEIKYRPLVDESEMLEVIVASMLSKLDSNPEKQPR